MKENNKRFGYNLSLKKSFGYKSSLIS